MSQKISINIGYDKISAVYHESPSKQDACVISCHGLLATKDSVKYIMLAEELNKQGISALRFDFRGCGESDGLLGESHISNRLHDLKAVIDYTNQVLGYKNIGLFGSSMGAFISFILASSDPRVKVMVSLSSPYSMAELFERDKNDDERIEIDGIIFGKNFIDNIKSHGNIEKNILENINCPTYIFHGDSDNLVPLEHAYKLFEEINAEKKMKIVLGGDHIFSHPFQLAEILGTSMNWFKTFLVSDPNVKE